MNPIAALLDLAVESKRKLYLTKAAGGSKGCVEWRRRAQNLTHYQMRSRATGWRGSMR